MSGFSAPTNQTGLAPDCSDRMERAARSGPRHDGSLSLTATKRTRFAGKSRRTSFLKRSRYSAVEKRKVTFWPAARQSLSSVPSQGMMLLPVSWLNFAKAWRHPINAKSGLDSVALNRWSACSVMAGINTGKRALFLCESIDKPGRSAQILRQAKRRGMEQRR